MSNFFFKIGFPKIEKMASGHLCLELSESVGYENFNEYAEWVISNISGKVKNKNNSYVICIWDVLVEDDSYRLVYEDCPCLISLESSSDSADERMEDIFRLLTKG